MNIINEGRFLINKNYASGTKIIIKELLQKKEENIQKKLNKNKNKQRMTKLFTNKSIDYYQQQRKKNTRNSENKNNQHEIKQHHQGDILKIFPRKINKTWLINQNNIIKDDYIIIVTPEEYESKRDTIQKKIEQKLQNMHERTL